MMSTASSCRDYGEDHKVASLSALGTDVRMLKSSVNCPHFDFDSKTASYSKFLTLFLTGSFTHGT